GSPGAEAGHLAQIWHGGAVPPRAGLAGRPYDRGLSCEERFLIWGAPGRIRTRDPLLRRQPLYPTELQAPDNLLCRAKVTRRTQSRAGLVALRSWPRTILSQLRGREPGQSAQSGPGCLRSWGDRRQNDRYPPARLKGPPVKGGLLVAGTTSDAGKSVLTAGLCRWLARKGVRVIE